MLIRPIRFFYYRFCRTFGDWTEELTKHIVSEIMVNLGFVGSVKPSEMWEPKGIRITGLSISKPPTDFDLLTINQACIKQDPLL